MTSGYQSQVVAEARQRLADVYRDIDGILKIQKQAKEQEQYNMDASTLYSAARLDVLALASDFDIFKQFVEENQKDLYANEYSYYRYQCDVIQAQIDYFESSIIVPTLTSPIASGSSENDTDVGRSFDAKVISVPDGDTLIVQQITDGGSPVNHSVRIAGIDAAEGGTENGKYVASKTAEFWLNKDVTVFYDRHTPNDLYGRVLGTVFSGDINFAVWSLERCYSSPNLKFGKNHFVDPEQLKLASSRCSVGCPLNGTVKLTTLPTHSSVRYGKIGGRLSLHSELTPCELVLPVGLYRISLSAPGCSTVFDEIEISAISKQLPVYSLPKLPGQTSLVVVDTPPVGRVVVLVDGEVVGVAPLSLELPVDSPVVVSARIDDREIGSEEIVPVIGEIKRVVFVP